MVNLQNVKIKALSNKCGNPHDLPGNRISFCCQGAKTKMLRLSARFDVLVACQEAPNGWGPETKLLDFSHQHFEAPFLFLRFFYYYFFFFLPYVIFFFFC